jgi:beta-phosphoglucomutase
VTAVRAIVFDFNGTLSDDEPLLYEVYAELFAEQGRPLTEEAYLEELAGNTEEEIIRRWLGRVDDELIAERIARYVERAADGRTVGDDVRAAVRYAADHVPIGVVSAATREEIDPVVSAAGLAGLFSVIVSSGDVTQGKPHPEPYERAAELLDLPPSDVLAFEDTEAGVASAKAAGMQVVAVTRTLTPERLAHADHLVPQIDVDVIRRFVPCSSSPIAALRGSGLRTRFRHSSGRSSSAPSSSRSTYTLTPRAGSSSRTIRRSAAAPTPRSRRPSTFAAAASG